MQQAPANTAQVTQFGRMCATLGVRLTVAKTPAAKSRVERVHRTNQVCLVKKLRRVGIVTYTHANQYLTTTFWSAHKTRFAVARQESTDSHLPLDPYLDPPPVFYLEVSP